MHSVLSFHIYLGSGDRTPVLQLEQNAPLPTVLWPPCDNGLSAVGNLDNMPSAIVTG